MNLALVLTLMSATAFAANEAPEAPVKSEAAQEEQEIQDMSDPLAIFTQVGAGVTDRGINLKVGQTYDTGEDTTAGMNVYEIKGIQGENLGFSDSPARDNSIDFLRLRQFEVDLTNGRGKQLDINVNFDGTHFADQTIDASYSIIQALPKMGPVNLFPLAGVGATFGNNVVDSFENEQPVIDDGFSGFGAYTIIGMYSKLAITDKLWLNYNPFYLQSLGGSDLYKAHAFGIETDSVLLHEFAVNYQISPRLNVRYFANWTENVDFKDGEHRIEFNYQL